jgi:plastocyanin
MMSWRWLGLVAVLVVAGGCSEGEERPASTDAVTPLPSARTNTPRGLVVGKAPVGPVGSPTVVILKPADAVDLPPPDFEPVMDQVQLTFNPGVLIARTGHPIVFRNSDEEMHNMNVKDSQTRVQTFNVGLPPEATYRYTFAQDGFYDVTCDVHPSMSASILVASTPFAAMTGADGSFTFTDVPSGDYVLTAYAGKEQFEKPVTVGSGRTDIQIGR